MSANPPDAGPRDHVPPYGTPPAAAPRARRRWVVPSVTGAVGLVLGIGVGGASGGGAPSTEAITQSAEYQSVTAERDDARDRLATTTSALEDTKTALDEATAQLDTVRAEKAATDRATAAREDDLSAREAAVTEREQAVQEREDAVAAASAEQAARIVTPPPGSSSGSSSGTSAGTTAGSSSGSSSGTSKPGAAAPSSSGGSTDPRYGTCKEAKSHGLGGYVRGVDPEYDWYRDSDGDGVVCE